jgi:beta-lactamase regulating signal transducer with metallopeptidase domain
MTSDVDGLALMAWAQLWQVTIVALGIGAFVRLCCRDRPRLAYALWMLVVVKSVVPPYWSSPTGLFSWALAGRATAQTVFNETSAGISMTSRAAASRDANAALAIDGIERAINHDPAIVWDRLHIAVVATWAAGFVFCAAFVLVKQVVCSILIRRSSVPVDERYVSALAALSQRLGVKRRVRLVVTSRPIGPAAFGLIGPSILMPAALLPDSPPEQVELVLAHELIHVRRGDILVGKLQLIAQLIWWFHPLVWWANREACRERELCCDGEVVSGTGCKPKLYARALLRVVEQKSRLRPLVAIPGVRALEVTSRRLESIMSSTKTDLRRASLIARVVFAVGAIVLVPGMGLTLRADPSVSDNPVATVETAPLKSADATLAQNAPAPEGKTTEGQDAKARWRAQQVISRKAEARYQSARLEREIAEIAVVEYEEGIYKQDLLTVQGEIKLAESNLSRSEDRLDWARRMHKKGYVSKTTVVSEEQTLKKARFALEQAQSKKKVLVDYTRGKTVKELKSAVEKARSDELAKKEAWDREKAKELALEREVIRSRAANGRTEPH